METRENRSCGNCKFIRSIRSTENAFYCSNPDSFKADCQVLEEDNCCYYMIKIDVVNHPSHYTQGKYEVIDIIEDATKDLKGIQAVCVANVLKYVLRHQYKNGLEDLKKAQWYLNKLIECEDK